MNLELSPGEKLAFQQAAQKTLAQRDPFSLIEEGHLKIKTKGAELVTFIPNRAQRRFLAIVKKLWLAGAIIRINVLKGRQLGISTVIEAIIFSITSQQENVNSLIVADSTKNSNNIFEMAKLYYEKIAEHLRPPQKRSNEKKLEFDGTHSQILIDTAGNPDAGRSNTFRLVHLSEYAFFDNVVELMSGLSQTVPALPQTMIVKESTAKGLNHFKEDWDRTELGQDDYVNIFCPWYWGDDYRMKVAEHFVLGDRAFGDVTADEKLLHNQMLNEGMDFIEERLQWRRWCIRNNCRGFVTIFRQEYPSNAAEAFVAEEKNVLITSAMLDAIRELTILTGRTKRVISCDPSLGGDECVMYAIENGKVIDEKIIFERDTMKIVAELMLFAKPHRTDDFVVDVIGIGKGIADRLNELGKRVLFFNSSNNSRFPLEFDNMRAEAYWHTMQQIRDKNVPGIQCQELRRQLTTTPFKLINSSGLVLIMAKDWIKTKLGRSPDRADCFVMGVWALQHIDFWVPAPIERRTTPDPYNLNDDDGPVRSAMAS